MRALLKSVPVLLVIAFTAACAPPPPPPAEAVELVDSVWGKYPALRAQLLAQEHRFADLPEAGPEKQTVDITFAGWGDDIRAIITWEQGLVPLLRSDAQVNRILAESWVARGGAAALAALKWPSTGAPAGWPADAPDAGDCIAHHVMMDRPFFAADAIEFCDPALRTLAWTSLTQ